MLKDFLKLVKDLDCIYVCASCHVKFRILQAGSWLNMDKESVNQIVKEAKNVSHGICPQCYIEVRKEILAIKVEQENKVSSKEETKRFTKDDLDDV